MFFFSSAKQKFYHLAKSPKRTYEFSQRISVVKKKVNILVTWRTQIHRLSWVQVTCIEFNLN